MKANELLKAVKKEWLPVASEDAVIMKDSEGNTTELTACAADFKQEAPKARPPAKQIERDPEVKAEAQDGSELARQATHRAIERAKERLQSYREGNQLIDDWTPEKHSLEEPNNTPSK